MSLGKLNTKRIHIEEYRNRADKMQAEYHEKNFSFKIKWHAVTNLELWFMSNLSDKNNRGFLNTFDHILPDKLTRMY